MNIVIIGAHPDDPEGGCGGFALKAVKAGHKVSCLYMTSGNRYGNAAEGQTVGETREMEARRAAEVIGAEPNFFRCGDKEVTFDTELLARVQQFIEDSKADLVLAHWPADLHPDHQAVGVLATQAVRSLPKVVLGYYEAWVGEQTFGLNPNRYVDISDVAEVKRRALYCHASQDPDRWYDKCHGTKQRWYGMVLGVDNAEAFYFRRSSKAVDELFDL